MKSIHQRILIISIVGALSACISGTKSPDTYVGQDGKTTIIESDAEMCKRSCNEDYDRCMESRSAGDNNSGINGPSGVFGASGDCRSDLQKCLPTCKSQ
jgi:hypothetical protein